MQTIIDKLAEGYRQNGLRVEIKDTPDWMHSCDKMIAVFRGDTRFLMIVHCIDTKADKIIASF